jgi:hypothetical protein
VAYYSIYDYMTPKYFRASAASSSSMPSSTSLSVSLSLFTFPSTSECPKSLDGAIRSRIFCLISLGSGNRPSVLRSKISSPFNSMDCAGRMWRREQSTNKTFVSHHERQILSLIYHSKPLTNRPPFSGGLLGTNVTDFSSPSPNVVSSS